MYADSGERRGRSRARDDAAHRNGVDGTGQRAGRQSSQLTMLISGPFSCAGPGRCGNTGGLAGKRCTCPRPLARSCSAPTPGSRLGAYLGPIPHWLYFTPLRKHASQWSTLVIWLSALGTATALVGIILGLSVRSPYRGTKRWHKIFGLIFGLGAATWAFSGMLSMDPFPSPRSGDGRLDAGGLERALRENVRLASFDAEVAAGGPPAAGRHDRCESSSGSR